MNEELRERARADLRVRRDDGSPDWVLWEHADRVAKLCDAIAGMPGVSSPSCNRDALRLAAYYHDAGWLVQVVAKQAQPLELLLRPTTDIQRELAADWIVEKLSKRVASGTLQAAARIIRECNHRNSDLLEARILADAENLDDIGPQSVGMLIRKLIADGKTLNDLVSSWRRQEEYHYWQARMKDGFHFASVRALAEQRCKAMRRFVLDLEHVLDLRDFKPGQVWQHATDLA